MKKQTEEIRKYKPCKRVNLREVREELSLVETLAQNFNAPERVKYNFHQVPVCGEVYLVADAKILNRHTNQSGRGNLRYLIDKESSEYVGLAKEKDSGDYGRVI